MGRHLSLRYGQVILGIALRKSIVRKRYRSLTFRTRQIELLSLARKAKDTVTEDVRAKASAETVVIPVVKIGNRKEVRPRGNLGFRLASDTMHKPKDYQKTLRVKEKDDVNVEFIGILDHEMKLPKIMYPDFSPQLGAQECFTIQLIENCFGFFFYHPVQ
ncbi:unnamed protein product [Porites lobata]|uniref:Ribosomal protein L5 n=1 Tax=Porites lobata TaxID=104759 RepID=A0ABN8NWZ9_9CNID|nr:unnamed protein product [Porites lobata]